MGPRDGLDAVEMRKCLNLPGLDSNPSVTQPIAFRCIDHAITAHLKKFEEWGIGYPRKYICKFSSLTVMKSRSAKMGRIPHNMDTPK
jgi:hypothetical protein